MPYNLQVILAAWNLRKARKTESEWHEVVRVAGQSAAYTVTFFRALLADYFPV